MLYVTGITGDTKIALFEAHTNSSITVTKHRLNKLVTKYNMRLVNAKIENKEVTVNRWPHEMGGWRRVREYNGMLLAQVDTDLFKLRYSNSTRYTNGDALKNLIDKGELSNCDYSTDGGVTQYMSKDTYRVDINKEFKQYIDEEYKKFVSKSAMLGIDTRFGYSVEGNEVILLRYNGKSKKVVIPNFITSIGYGSFSGAKIEKLKLNAGLKFIGTKAFTGNDLESVEIPETVKFTYQEAFSAGCRVNFRSRKTIILDSITGGYK